MRATAILVALASSLMLGSGACGSTPPTPEADPHGGGDQSAGNQGATGSGEGETGTEAAAAAAGAVPMPVVGGTGDESPPRQQGQPPAITDVASAERAAAQGFYAPAERFLVSVTGSDQPRALLALGRVQLETGRYDDAARTAARAAQTAAVRVDAETLRGEALMARGRLDEAERVLGAVASSPGAFRASVLLGRLLDRRGRSVEAQPNYMRLIEAYNDGTIGPRSAEGLSYVAMAAWGLGSVQDANDAFRESAAADATRVETQVEWAQLFLEKYDAGHAEESIQDALEHNPESATAHAVMARIRIEQSFDFAAATAYSERALEIAPDLVMAHVTLAGMDLRDLDFAAADAHLNRALQVNPNDLETLSARAAVRFLADDAQGFEAAKREVFRRNRGFSRMYSIVAEYADWEHRYPEIVRMAREAVTLDPNDAFAHGTLGLNLLRMGEEPEGLTALREAWRRDRFNVHVFNTLNLYDDVIAVEYETFESGPFVFRMHREERPVLEHYVPATLRRAYDDMRRRYGFTPQGPVRIELFADPQHFSVRTTGLPNIGVQGVCFGKVVTAISPRGGPFNWGQITWHELAHVFHIQMSRNHVPRWFTEGLAEYETIVARPEWQREDDNRLFSAIDGDTLPPLRLMNRAFTHARSPDDMMTAYYASSQVVKYIVERFGFPKVVEMLQAWGAGRATNGLIQQVLGVSVDVLDRDFRAHTRQRLAARAADFTVDFGRYRDLDALERAATQALQDAGAQAALAAGRLVRGDADGARTAAEAALRLGPTNAMAHFLMAQLTMAAGDGPATEQHLRAVLAAGKDGYEVRLLLARVALARNDRQAARRELDAAARIDADRPEAWQGLSAVAEQTNDADLRLRALENIVRIDQHDRESWIDLMVMLAERSRWADLARVGEGALFLDPHNAEVHRLLGLAYVETNRARDGLAELDVALLAHPERPAAVHLARARTLMALRRRPDASRAAEEAVRADPSVAEEARRITSGRAGP